jgi:predicted ATP-dependent serine protease
MMFVCVGCQTQHSERLACCFVCGTPSCVVPAYQRAVARSLGQLQRTTAQGLVRMRMNELRLDAAPDLRIGEGALVVLWGAPGAGKSTLALRWLDSVQGPVVLYAAEEGLSVTLGERMQRLGVTRPTLHVVGHCAVDELAGVVSSVRARALLIDSLTVTPLTPHDVRTLSVNLGLPVTFVVAQVNKAGELRGTNELLHEADVGVVVENQRWSVVKSRYQEVPPEGALGGRVLGGDE